MKRVFALVLCLCMVLAMVPAAFAAELGNVSVNGTAYNTVEEALAAASAGDTITLQKDMSAGQIIVPKGVTLNLNGFALTADMFIVFNGAVTGGEIVVEQNLMKIIGDNNGNLPVWNADKACYTFASVKYQQMMQVAPDLSYANYIFVPNLDAATTAMLANGGADNGISVKVLLNWNNGQSQQIYTFSEEMVATVYGSANAGGTLGKVFQLTVTGFAGIEDMTACAVVESTAGGKAVNDASKVALPEPEPTVPETTEPTVPETEPTVPETEPTTPAEPVTETFAMADLDKDAAGGATTSRKLGDKVVFTISSGWFTTQARIYQNANGVLASTVGMSSVTLNMGYKTNTFDVYTSEDGEEWTLYKEGVAYTSAYSDITIDFGTPVNYVKIDANKAQIRIQNISITFVGGASEPSEPEATEPTVPETEPTVPETEPTVPETEPTTPVDPPAAGGDYSDQAEIMEQIKVLAAGESISNVTLTGEITKINTAYDSTYKNVTVTIKVFGTEDTLKCYRIKGDAASILAVGDTITVNGVVKNYQHSSGDTELEFDAGSMITEHIPAEGGTTEPTVPETEPTVPETEPTEPAGFQVVDAPVAGTAYKFGMIQKNVSETDVYYLNGNMSSYYMATTTDTGAAVDVYLEETEGGYYLYAMVGGAKKYINMVVSDTHVNGKYEDAASTVYTYNADSKTVIAVVNDADYWMGTRNDKTYTTVGPVKTSYNGFYMQFYAEVTTEPEIPETEPTVPETEPTVPETEPTVPETEPTVPETEPPVTNDTLTIAEAIALGATMEKDQYTTEKYYVTGVISQVDNDMYGNVYITDGAGNYLYVYGLYSADGSARYDAMNPKPDEGDTVTLYGAVGKYTDVQMKSAWVIDFTPGELEKEEVEGATITFDNTSKRTAYSTTQQIWEENGIVVTNNKGASTSNVGNYYKPARFYKSSTLIIEFANGINQIVFDCNNTTYASDLAKSITNGAVTVEGDKVTVVLDAPATSFTVEKMAAQVRVDALTVS